MPKYLFQGSYTEQGLKGLMQEGAAKRRAVVAQMAAAMGGQLEAMYFAFGSDDIFVLIDAPGNVDATALSLAVNASGALKIKTTVLITPEEVDQALQKTVKFRPPGQ
jgi:uncharacterized protein with GYD domain